MSGSVFAMARLCTLPPPGPLEVQEVVAGAGAGVGVVTGSGVRVAVGVGVSDDVKVGVGVGVDVGVDVGMGVTSSLAHAALVTTSRITAKSASNFLISTTSLSGIPSILLCGLLSNFRG